MPSPQGIDPERTLVNGKPLAECSHEELATAIQLLVRHVADLELRRSPPPPSLADGYLSGIVGGPGGVSYALHDVPGDTRNDASGTYSVACGGGASARADGRSRIAMGWGGSAFRHG